MGAGALRAKSVIENLGIRDVEDLQLLDLIAFELGAIVKRSRLQVAEARLVVGRPRSVITVSTSTSTPRRERFSIVHELGHLELHRHERVFPCDAESINDWPTKGSKENIEQEANEFAAGLLLPEKIFAPICRDMDPSMEGVQELAERFNVSIMATARRFIEYCYSPAAVVWTERRQIRWFQRNEPFEDLGFFVNVNSMIEGSTVASSFFDGEYMPTSSEIIKASAWMMEGGYKDMPIREQCVPMPKYNGVLSLLWVEEDWIDEVGDLDW
jgi:Zn-dependent peptidase ImmA (M78 family)